MNIKNLIKLIVVVVILVVVYVWIRKRNSENKDPEKSNIVKEWKKHPAQEFTKDVWFEDKTWVAQVKNINRYDIALLADGRLVIWDQNQWMPASISDIILKN